MKNGLTEAQVKNLRWLVERGGSGYLDQYSRLVAGGECASQGSWASWLHLTAKCCLRGEMGRLVVTALGRQYLGLSPKTIEEIERKGPSSGAEMDALLEDQLGGD